MVKKIGPEIGGRDMHKILSKAFDIRSAGLGSSPHLRLTAIAPAKFAGIPEIREWYEASMWLSEVIEAQEWAQSEAGLHRVSCEGWTTICALIPSAIDQNRSAAQRAFRVLHA